MLNSGARPGDQLLLTKPLGSGIISTAIKGGLVNGREGEKITTTCMTTLNRISGEALAAVGGHGCTDITGFGLIGHLHEMASSSRVSIKISAAEVPLLEKVLDFADMGIIPEGAHNNRKFYRKQVTSSLAENHPLEMVFYDPQTSGGLLIAASSEQISAIIKLINSSGYPLPTAIIGEVVKRQEKLIFIEP
jgi:selenide,water dikinase